MMLGTIPISSTTVFSDIIYLGHCNYIIRGAAQTVLQTLVKFYILPHTLHVCVQFVVCVLCIHVFRMLLPTAPGFQNSWKTNPVALKHLKQPTEVSTLIPTVGFKLIQDSGLQVAEILLEGGT